MDPLKAKKNKIGPMTKKEFDSYGFKNKDVSHLGNKYRNINKPYLVGTKTPTKKDSASYDAGFKFGAKNHYNKKVNMRESDNFYRAGVKEGRSVYKMKPKDKNK